MDTGISRPKTVFANTATAKIASNAAFDICAQRKGQVGVWETEENKIKDVKNHVS